MAKNYDYYRQVESPMADSAFADVGSKIISTQMNLNAMKMRISLTRWDMMQINKYLNEVATALAERNYPCLSA
jgi:hypothetical protein